jgi:hypothetical protein
VGEERIGVLDHMFKQSLLRSTWTVRDGNEDELMIARERSLFGAIARRAIDFVPDIGGLIPIPYNFDFLANGTVVAVWIGSSSFATATSSKSAATTTSALTGDLS